MRIYKKYATISFVCLIAAILSPLLAYLCQALAFIFMFACLAAAFYFALKSEGIIRPYQKW